MVWMDFQAAWKCKNLPKKCCKYTTRKWIVSHKAAWNVRLISVTQPALVPKTIFIWKKTIMKKSAILTALSIGVMSVSVAFANPAAVAQVRNNSVEVMKILNQSNGKNNAQVIRQAEAYAAPYFDFEGMTALAVGMPWRKATPAQKSQLVSLFKDRLINQYAQAMSAYKGAKVEVSDKTVKRGNSVIVQAKITPVGKPVIDAQFMTRPSGGKYRIYNATFAGVSPIDGYKIQFRDTINKKGIDGLIADLRAKNGR